MAFPCTGFNSFAPAVEDLRVDYNLTSPAITGDRTPLITFIVTDSTEIKRVLISISGGNNITLEGAGDKKSKTYEYTPTTNLTPGNHTIEIYTEDDFRTGKIYSYIVTINSVGDSFASHWDTTKTSSGSSNS